MLKKAFLLTIIRFVYPKRGFKNTSNIRSEMNLLKKKEIKLDNYLCICVARTFFFISSKIDYV